MGKPWCRFFLEIERFLGFVALPPATPLGDMLAVASIKGLCLLEFIGQQGIEREQRQMEAARGGPSCAGVIGSDGHGAEGASTGGSRPRPLAGTALSQSGYGRFGVEFAS